MFVLWCGFFCVWFIVFVCFLFFVFNKNILALDVCEHL